MALIDVAVAPVSASWSRRQSSKVVRGSTSSSRNVPLTSSSMRMTFAPERIATRIRNRARLRMRVAMRSGAKVMRIELDVNGTLRELEVEPRTTLLDCLRDQLALTGATATSISAIAIVHTPGVGWQREYNTHVSDAGR